MATPIHTVILGASYGSLLASKLLLAGHAVTLVCLASEADLINARGTRVRLPVRGRDHPVELDSRELPGRLSASTPAEVDLDGADLVALAMQEPQYAAPEVRALLERVSRASLPCVSIMNMPPLAYLARIPGLDTAPLRKCYTEPAVWDAFDPALVTLASPDPQAFRPPQEPLNVLQVGLPTNFKVARFEARAHDALLRRLQADIEAARLADGRGDIAVPVKLKVHDSLFVPLAKWSMLLTGNYRCVGETGMRSIHDAVHTDLELSRSVYEWVAGVCRSIGASDADLVPFDKYARAAAGLGKPSSAARALAAGAKNVERVDCIVRTIAAARGMSNPTVDATAALVDAWLERNRNAA